MLIEVTGDILMTKAQVIAHGVAPNDSFSTGLASSLRERWPAMYKDFRHFYQLGHPKPGGAWVWSGADGKRIVNLFTQEEAAPHTSRPGRATLENVNHTLRELHKMAEKEKFSSLALPRLSTGVGGLEWDDVKPLIAKHLGNLQIPVVIYAHYSKGVSADEKI